jgi:hypothetical protein
MRQVTLPAVAVARTFWRKMCSLSGEATMLIQVLANGAAIVCTLMLAHRSAPEGLVHPWRGRRKRAVQ